jgi:hypothetical protein
LAAKEGRDLHDVGDLPAAQQFKFRTTCFLHALCILANWEIGTHAPDGLSLEALVDVRHDGDVESGLDSCQDLLLRG